MKKLNKFLKTALPFGIAVAATLLSLTSKSQTTTGKPYTLVYSSSLKGGHTAFGNTSMAIYKSDNVTIDVAKMDSFKVISTGQTSPYTNNSSNMKFVDVDGDATTTNSSTADLILPAGTNTIKFARLYWGSRVSVGMSGANNVNLRKVKIRKGTSGAYDSVLAPITQVDKLRAENTDSAYRCYADITSFIQTNGAGTYSVANIVGQTLNASSSTQGFFAGWTIVVVYENTALPYSSVRVYDGFQDVGGTNGNTFSSTLTGFNTPSTPLDSADAYMTVMAWEGDALPISGVADYLLVNGDSVKNSKNPGNNFWNSTITKNGSFVSTRNPYYKTNMGIDLDEVNVGVGYGITSNATSVDIKFGTSGDHYFPTVFAFTMKTKDPNVTLAKNVSDGTYPYHVLQTNEILTYTLIGSNVGAGPANNCGIVDTIPSNVTYVPGSLQVLTSPVPSQIGTKTDAAGDDIAFVGTAGSKSYVKFFGGTGATSSAGGVLQSGEGFSIQFQVITPSAVNLISTVVNTARITAQSVSGDPFIFDATAIIGPEGGPLPVKLISFTAQKDNSDVLLKWTTATELQNDRFEVEQSTDGIKFTTIGSIKGNGSTQTSNSYTYRSSVLGNTAKVLYYRLKTFDIDGNIFYTKIISVNFSGTVNLKNFSVYPNPFVNNVKMQIQSDKEENVAVKILNANGQVLINRNVNLQSGENIVVLKDLDALSKGVHTIEVITDKGIVSQRIIK